MPTVQYDVTASANDGYWTSTGNFDNTATNLFGGSNGGTLLHSYFRFVNIAIPPRSDITSCTLTYEADASLAATIVRTDLFFNDVASAASPGSAAAAEALALTTAFTAYDSIAAQTAGNSYTSPDISAALQEVIDRGDWASGNAIMVLWKDGGSSATAYRQAASFNHTTRVAPYLTVTYTPKQLLPILDSYRRRAA